MDLNILNYIKGKNKFIITIDGGAGTGKTTITKLLSKKLGLLTLHTSFYFRKLAYDLKLENIISTDQSKIQEYLNNNQNLEYLDNNFKFLMNEEIGLYASNIAQYQFVRSFILKLQKDFINKYPKIIIEGRDGGSVLAKKADIKFYLEANIEVRAQRRFKQLKKSKINNLNIEDIKKSILQRDEKDSNRKYAPLLYYEDAIKIDTSHKSFKEILSEIKGYIFKALII